jgi:uncharacterized coiled-coil protein SlyX
MSDEELKQLIASNTKAIQALSDSLTESKKQGEKDREEWKKDRKQMYEWMSKLSASQANFWEIQADYYRRLEDVEDRQAKMLEILDRVTQKDS